MVIKYIKRKTPYHSEIKNRSAIYTFSTGDEINALFSELKLQGK
jgi:hypothetical protein